jgi:adenine-specific DNA-methyltransferase
LTGPSLQKTLDKGFVRVSKKDDSDLQPYVFSYLTHPNIKKVTDGKLTISGERDDGSLIVIDPTGKKSRPTTTWNNNSHEAGAYGTSLLGALIPNRKFPFPKSLYAVQDTLELIVRDNKQAIILDFFSGSGTTAHAVMRLNHLDGGSRQSISITNNEVSAEEQRSLRERNLRPGDADWEKWGICEYITKPRIKAAITGETPEGNLIEGEYKFNDEFPISNGFSENVEFFTLSYESPISISHNLAFERIASLLWLRAGSFGKRISQLPINGWDLVEAYGVLIDLDKSNEFSQAINISETSKIAYIVTNDDRRFQAVARQMPDLIEPVRLYESYLNNFQFANGE